MNRKALSLLIISLIIAAGLLAGCSGEEKEVIAYFPPGEYIVVNVSDTYRLVKIVPVLVLNKALTDESADGEATIEDELTALTPIIREKINEIARMKDEASLRSAGIMDQLRTEITQALNESLGLDYITSVQFSDFVVQ